MHSHTYTHNFFSFPTSQHLIRGWGPGLKSAGQGLNQLVQSDTGQTHNHPHSFTHSCNYTKEQHTHNKPWADGREEGHDIIQSTSSPLYGGGGIEVAILRARVSVLCEGDFGQAGVVIGYTYKCLFLPLPHVHFKLSRSPLPFPPTMLPFFPSPEPRTWLQFRHEWGVKREREQWNEEKVRGTDDWLEKQRRGRKLLSHQTKKEKNTAQ